MPTITGPLLYVLIFCGKVIEVTFSTLRIMLVGKGRRFLGAFVGLFEIVFWVVITNSVLTGLTEDPLKIVVYSLAFSTGIICGIAVEARLAVGLTSIQILTPEEPAETLGALLRENGFGVTIFDGHSVDGTPREMLFVQLKRRRVGEAVSLVHRACPGAVISVSDVRSLTGGFVKK